MLLASRIDHTFWSKCVAFKREISVYKYIYVYKSQYFNKDERGEFKEFKKYNNFWYLYLRFLFELINLREWKATI